MNNTNKFLPLIGRILLAAIFLMSGLGKLADPAAAMGYIASIGLPLPGVALAGAIAVEVGGGLLIAIGLYSRITALAMAAFSIATALLFHNALGDQNQMIHFMKNISIAGGFLQIAAFGAGAFSLDARRPAARLATAG
ncbi:DoxX family protein [Massilia sp. SM-13]|uniref:DoxX family protein n=1 Tax=Pseudoduganella rhizocola TaxID=3382643 RepID=UPI0038B4FB5C